MISIISPRLKSWANDGGVVNKALNMYKKPFENDFWLEKSRRLSYHIDTSLCITFEAFNIKKDIIQLQHWVNLPYAKYWQLENSSIEKVAQTYQEILDNKNTCIFWGMVENKKAFLVEFYYAPNDRIGKHYPAKIGDYGFHILVGPKEKVIPQFTTHIFFCLLSFLFENEKIDRIVVEPDAKNEKIHVLNKKAGFVYDKEVELEEKTAFLAFCDRESFSIAKEKLKLNYVLN